MKLFELLNIVEAYTKIILRESTTELWTEHNNKTIINGKRLNDVWNKEIKPYENFEVIGVEVEDEKLYIAIYNKQVGASNNSKKPDRAIFETLVENIFGGVENFLDCIEDYLPVGYDLAKAEDECYLVNREKCLYVNWYKITHIGRDLHTNMNSDELAEFLKELKLKADKQGEKHE